MTPTPLTVSQGSGSPRFFPSIGYNNPQYSLLLSTDGWTG